VFPKEILDSREGMTAEFLYRPLVNRYLLLHHLVELRTHRGASWQSRAYAPFAHPFTFSSSITCTFASWERRSIFAHWDASGVSNEFDFIRSSLRAWRASHRAAASHRQRSFSST
jgi:hypothetical protein